MDNVAHDHHCTCADCRGVVDDDDVIALPGQLPSEADREWQSNPFRPDTTGERPPMPIRVQGYKNPGDDDRDETRDRAQSVVHALESCHEELTRLELIPTSDADDVNALSAAKGFIARARTLLRGRFQ